MSAINVGAVSVDVLPDMSRFRPEVDRVVRDLPTFQVDIGADTTAARAAVDEVARARSASIDVNVDDALAAAKLEELSRDRTAELTIRERHVSDGGGGIGLLGAGILASPLAAPLGVAGLAGGAGLAAGATAGLAGLGTLVLGLSGIKAAVDAVSKAHAGAGAAAAASAVAQANAAAAVQGAQASLTNAIANAANQQITAEQNLAAAQQSEQLAQQNLTIAREQARQQLQDLTLSVQDGALAQRQATLNVIAAHKALERVQLNAASTELQRQQAKLTYDQAVQQVTDIGVRQSRLQAQQKAAAKAGVEGSTQVVAAQRNIAQAHQAVANAVRAQANTARQGQASVAAAQLAFQNAQRGAAVAAQQTSTATKTAATALAALSPAGRSFATFVIGSLEPALAKIKAAAAGGLLPGLQAGLSDLLPVLPQISTLVGTVASAVGDLFKAGGQALRSPFFQSFFKDLASNLGPAVRTLGGIVGNLATAFAGLFQAFLPISQQIGGGLLDLTKRFADFATHLGSNAGFQSFLVYVKAEGPPVVHFFGELFTFVGKLARAFAPLGAVLLGAVSGLVGFLDTLDPGTFQAIALSLLGVFAAVKIGGAAIGAVKFVTEAWTAVTKIAAAAQWLLNAALNANPVGLVVIGIAALAAGLVYAYKHSETFRNIVDGAFKAVADAGSFMWNDVLKPTFKFLVDTFLDVAGAIVHGAASAFGWVPEIGGNLKNAAKHFDEFKDSVNKSLSGVNNISFSVITGYANPQDLTKTHRYAAGGAVTGPGSSTSDSIPALLSAGEHVWSAAEVQAAGGHGAVAAMRGGVLSHADSLARSTGAISAQSVRNAAASSSTSSTVGTHIESITINNPVPEPASVSSAAQLRRLAFTLGAVT